MSCESCPISRTKIPLHLACTDHGMPRLHTFSFPLGRGPAQTAVICCWKVHWPWTFPWPASFSGRETQQESCLILTLIPNPDSIRLSCSLCVIKNQWWSVFFQNHNKAKSATKSRTCSVKGCLESKSEIPLWYSLNFFDRSTYFTWVMRSFYLQISIRMQRACAALQTISQQCRSCDPSHQGRQQIPRVRTGLVFRCGLTSRGANLVQFGLPWLSFGDFGEPPILGSQIMFRIAQQ